MRSISKCTYVMMILAFLPCISFAQCVRTPYTGDNIRTMVYGLAFKGSGGGGSFYDGLTIAQTLTRPSEATSATARTPAAAPAGPEPGGGRAVRCARRRLAALAERVRRARYRLNVMGRRSLPERPAVPSTETENCALPPREPTRYSECYSCSAE